MSRRQLAASAERPTLEYLRHRGPHEIVAGELDAIGVPGLVFAPDTAARGPAVILAHGLLQPTRRYADTLRFLASWGFIAAAPATGRGPLPSHSGFALDLCHTADALTRAKLHRGRVTVDRNRIALVGHGIGGGAAVLAAVRATPPIQAVVTLFAAETSPSAVEAARRATMPSLHLIGGKDEIADPATGGIALARTWAGPAQLRRLPGAHHLSASEGKHITSELLGVASSPSVLATIRTLLTAFLLLHLSGCEWLAPELAESIRGTQLAPVSP